MTLWGSPEYIRRIERTRSCRGFGFTLFSHMLPSRFGRYLAFLYGHTWGNVQMLYTCSVPHTPPLRQGGHGEIAVPGQALWTAAFPGAVRSLALCRGNRF